VSTILFFLGLATFPSGGLAFNVNGVSVDDVIREIANYEAPSNDVLGPAIGELGFSQTPGWGDFPAIRKLTQMYASADASTAGDGNRAVAAVAKKLSSRFDSLRNNPRVKAFIDQYGGGGQFQFAAVKPSIGAIGPETRAVIEILADYVENGQLGGSYGILTRTFGLTSDDAFEIISRSNTTTSALLRGLSSVPIDQQADKVRALVYKAAERYSSLKNSAAYLAYVTAVSGGADGSDTSVSRKRSEDLDPLVECLCGGRPIGVMRKSQCHVGMPCE
jgi:hypothetical protein